MYSEQQIMAYKEAMKLILLGDGGRSFFSKDNDSSVVYIDREYKGLFANFLPSMTRAPWQLTVAYYESLEGIQQYFAMDNDREQSTYLRRFIVARLVLKLSKKLKGKESDKNSLYKWILEDGTGGVDANLEIIAQSIKILKIVTRAFIKPEID